MGNALSRPQLAGCLMVIAICGYVWIKTCGFNNNPNKTNDSESNSSNLGGSMPKFTPSLALNAAHANGKLFSAAMIGKYKLSDEQVWKMNAFCYSSCQERGIKWDNGWRSTTNQYDYGRIRSYQVRKDGGCYENKNAQGQQLKNTFNFQANIYCDCFHEKNGAVWVQETTAFGTGKDDWFSYDWYSCDKKHKTYKFIGGSIYYFCQKIEPDGKELPQAGETVSTYCSI